MKHPMMMYTDDAGAEWRAARRTARAIAVACALGALSAACGLRREASDSTVVISVAGDADVLFPPTARQLLSKQVTDLVFDKLADIGPGLITVGDTGWAPRLARRWTWSADSMAVTFHLDPRARWHDGAPVRATDVAFAFAVYTDTLVAAADGADLRDIVDSLSVGDSLTCTAWFRRRSPERFYKLVFSLVPLPAHLLSAVPHDSLRTSPFGRAPVGDGPYRFVRWDPKQRIEIAAEPNYYRGRAGPDRVIWTEAAEGQAAAQQVFAGAADFIETLTPAEVADLAAHAELRAVHLRGNAYGYLVFNLRDGQSRRPHPILGDRAVRRALTMALDRPSIVSNLLDSLGRVATGPFVTAQWSADTTLRQIPFDRAAAAHMLDSLGWRAGPDGVRVRGGRRFALSLVVPSSSQARQRLAVLLQEQWRQVGVKLDVDRVELATMNARIGGGAFDAVLMQVATSPSPSGIRQAWSSAAITMANGFNFGRYSNPRVDADIDTALTATSFTVARAAYRSAYQALIDDAPAIWLFEPVIVAAANRRLSFGTFRPDAWWMSIPSWQVSGRAPGVARRDTTPGR